MAKQKNGLTKGNKKKMGGNGRGVKMNGGTWENTTNLKKLENDDRATQQASKCPETDNGQHSTIKTPITKLKREKD